MSSAHDLYAAYGVPERMGYHCHRGPHLLRPDDWEAFMDFADREMKAPSAADSDEIERRIAVACADDFTLVFGSTDRFYNQDGVDVRKGCHDLVIENISGSTGDDAVALTALRTSAGDERYGMQIGGTASRGEADDVYNVTVRNVRAKSAGGHGVIRLLNADGIRMHHIVVSNVVDTASGSDKRPHATIRLGDANFSTISRCKRGEMHHITVRDVKASGPVAVRIGGPLSDSSVTGVTPIPGGKRYSVKAPIDRVELDRTDAAHRQQKRRDMRRTLLEPQAILETMPIIDCH